MTRAYDHLAARLAGTALHLSLTVVLVAVHVAMALLHGLGRATPGATPTLDVGGVDRATAWEAWAALHVAIAAGLVAGLARRHVSPALLVIACHVSAGTSLVWGLPVLLWSIPTQPPASLTGPVLMLVAVLPVGTLSGSAWGHVPPGTSERHQIDQ